MTEQTALERLDIMKNYFPDVRDYYKIREALTAVPTPVESGGREWQRAQSIVYNLYERPHGVDRIPGMCNEVTIGVSVDKHSELSEDKAVQMVLDAMQALGKVENAHQAMCETSKSWKSRCYSVGAALGLDFGDEDWVMPDEAGGWVVTNGDGTLYRTWANGMCQWTGDINTATRYFRRQDAEDVHHDDEDAWKVIPCKAIEEPSGVIAKGVTEVPPGVQLVALDGTTYQPDRWEVGFRNIVTVVVGPRSDFEIKDIVEIVRAKFEDPDVPLTFQKNIDGWMRQCFGPVISMDKVERGDRLAEEVFELLQSGGYNPLRLLPLISYTWGRPAGEPLQELGGVMVTLAAYATPHGLDLRQACNVEYERINTPEMIEKIRQKQLAKKDIHGPLP